MTDEACRHIWLLDIASIKTAGALRVWADRDAGELRDSPHRDELKQSYLARLKELEGK